MIPTRAAIAALHVFAFALIVSACSSPVPTNSPDGSLPTAVGGQPVTYQERSADDLGPQADFFVGPITEVGGKLATSRVAVGLGIDGLSITAVQVPGADARRLLDPLIAAADLHPTARLTQSVGGRPVTVLVLPPTTKDRLYVYAFDDTVVMVATSHAEFADEVIRSLP
jgi:hypothetical protein